MRVSKPVEETPHGVDEAYIYILRHRLRRHKSVEVILNFVL